MVSDNRWLLVQVMALNDLGRRAEAKRLLAEHIPAELQRSPEAAPFQIAPLYAYMGEFDSAFEWIERGLAIDPSPRVRHFLDWRYQAMMQDPRWQRVRDLFPGFAGWEQVRKTATPVADD